MAIESVFRGASYSGGHALFMGAFDPRVKAVVAQVPALEIAPALVAMVGRDTFVSYLQLFAADHDTRNRGGQSGRVPIVAPQGQPSVFPTPDSYEWFMSSRTMAPNWVDTTTFESLARMVEYRPAASINLISPKPLLILAGAQDAFIPIEQIRAAFAQAGEPKKLVEVDCGHYEFFPGGRFHERALHEATEWFRTRHSSSSLLKNLA